MELLEEINLLFNKLREIYLHKELIEQIQETENLINTLRDQLKIIIDVINSKKFDFNEIYNNYNLEIPFKIEIKNKNLISKFAFEIAYPYLFAILKELKEDVENYLNYNYLKRSKTNLIKLKFAVIFIKLLIYIIINQKKLEIKIIHIV